MCRLPYRQPAPLVSLLVRQLPLADVSRRFRFNPRTLADRITGVSTGMQGAMMSSERLDTLMQRALADKTVEPVFFRALLEATVYAHTPRAGHNGRLRLIQFALPDNGRMVCPSSATKHRREQRQVPRQPSSC